uniref:Protein YIF1 n=1 Tax=Helicotheca tamesis TaxID=374047 RepID=A0A7S2GX20_9STRA|mmetsp:Transcript_12977/g.17835  ORF Transcript_12977/g.17835 Transcript_12977/m.17835 type:complete len:372 (+) Transcript_12977:148-1263(+)|eukprot:CAMPEP_0185738728 /NCGR_PEP_ID=MMETSP1171-20130828/33736_1 /TAXON_ID=374046 /ORGANISM="Helicotheca tamensis, Strain CCMP826" /LENGTH=371 /DNA_ID=CAMNT_0028410067 /DNA_START=73 /DNA_END=1188 /DNA_ORIENTATION=+
MSDFYSQQAGQQPGSSTSGGASFYSQGGGYGQQQTSGTSAYQGYGGSNSTNNLQQQQQQPNQSPTAANPQQWQQQTSSAPAPGGATAQTTQQQAAAAQPINFWNPNMSNAAAATFMQVAGKGFSGESMAGAAEQFGQTFLDEGTARMIPGFESAMKTLRVYFGVDNHYVKKKMQRVLFPVFFKQWKRMEVESTNPNVMVEYALPYSDENAPDLYIPVMALVTYVLLCALCYGTAGKFDPEVLPDVTTKCFITQLLEVLVMKGCIYSMEAPMAFLDLFSYTGYKYLGLCVNMLVGLAIGYLSNSESGYGHKGYYVAFLWTASAISYFFLKTMANNIPMVTAKTGPKREFMVLGFAASQFATCWFVSQTKFLN